MIISIFMNTLSPIVFLLIMPINVLILAWHSRKSNRDGKYTQNENLVSHESRVML